MKFLCVPCDTAMKLEETKSPDRGSVSLVYGCPECGYEFAMLTNPHETQLVTSLGVSLGSEGAAEGGKCPFTGMVRDLAAQDEASGSGARWTREAEARMAAVPEFVKPMVKTGIERFARERGYREIDERVLDEAKGAFGL